MILLKAERFSLMLSFDFLSIATVMVAMCVRVGLDQSPNQASIGMKTVTIRFFLSLRLLVDHRSLAAILETLLVSP